jgi:hypothetical protein
VSTGVVTLNNAASTLSTQARSAGRSRCRL